MTDIGTPHDHPIKYLDIAEFQERGYLQESNRLFFHPLGLALEIRIAEDGTKTLGGIWDYRDDPEGMIFHEFDKEKAEAIYQERMAKVERRLPLGCDTNGIQTNSIPQ